MKILIALMVLCSLLLGCSGTRKYWTKENLDPKQYRKDESYCREQARSSEYKSEDIYKQCMFSLGYIYVEEKEERR